MAPGVTYRPLKIAPPLSESPGSVDGMNSISRSSASCTPPINGQHAGSRSRGSQTVVACMACRKRKSKVSVLELKSIVARWLTIEQCSRERPRCSTCWSKRTECVYETEEGQTRLEHLRSINTSLRNRVGDMSVIIHFLQCGAYEEAIEVLHRLRGSQSMQDTVRLIRDSQLMLPDDKCGSRDPLRIAKEDSTGSSHAGSTSSSANVSHGSPTTDPSLMTIDGQHEVHAPCTPANVTLPSLASLTSGADGAVQSPPSPHRGGQMLPPLSISVGGGSFV